MGDTRTTNADIHNNWTNSSTHFRRLGIHACATLKADNNQLELKQVN